VQRCGAPGVYRCYDCAQGTMLRERGDVWLPCAEGEKCATEDGVPANMCSDEHGRKGATCATCGAAPICRRCRPAHDKVCNPGAKRRTYDSSSSESDGGGAGAGRAPAASEEEEGGGKKKGAKRGKAA
jgi:hypothetical protein